MVRLQLRLEKLGEMDIILLQPLAARGAEWVPLPVLDPQSRIRWSFVRAAATMKSRFHEVQSAGVEESCNVAMVRSELAAVLY